MAPFLAVGGYGLADLYMTSKEEIENFLLVPKGECRPVENACEVEGIGLTLYIKFDKTPQSNQLLPVTVTSKDRLDDVGLSISSANEESTPVGANHNDLKTVWNTSTQLKPIDNIQPLTLRLVISEDGKMHFAEVPVLIKE